MLRIVNLHEIQSMLLSIPSLVDLQEQRSPDFAENVRKWLSKLEKALESNRLQVAGNIAALRALLVSAEQGVIPAGLQFQGRTTRRRIREAASAFVLREAGDLVSNVIQMDCGQVAEAERLARQLVAMAKAKGLLQELPGGENFTDMLKAIWRAMSQDPDLSAGTVNIEGLVGPHDALIVLDRTITRDVKSG